MPLQEPQTATLLRTNTVDHDVMRAAMLVRTTLEQEMSSRGSPAPPSKPRTARILAAIALAVVGASSGAAPLSSRDPYAQPARIVRLSDGRAMNLVCSGKGLPTVVLESGFGAGAFAWDRVQPLIAAQTRVCSYDRAGYGFSEPGPMPRDGEAIARDLDQMLKRAGERGPFVIVGHSAGGLYARLFAARRPREIAGLVLVDTSVPFQDRRVAAVFGNNAGNLEGARRRPAACLEAAQKGSEAALEAGGCLPHDGTLARAIAAKPGPWETQLSELDTLFTSTSVQVGRTVPVIREVPAIVLTASRTGLPAGPSEPGAMVWQELHHEIAASFLGGRQRLVKSSHLMMSDRPEVVAAAALELVRSARKTEPAGRS